MKIYELSVMKNMKYFNKLFINLHKNLVGSNFVFLKGFLNFSTNLDTMTSNYFKYENDNTILIFISAIYLKIN